MSMYDLGVGKHTMTCVVTRGGVKEEALPLGQQAGSRVLTRWCAEVAASLVMCLYNFFFSSRRRHTRCLSDWSSDVCSSDLQPIPAARGLFVSAYGLVQRAPEFVFDGEKQVAEYDVLTETAGADAGWIFGTRSEERRVGKECRCRWSRTIS